MKNNLREEMLIVMSVHKFLQQLKEKGFVVDPSFQRRSRWKDPRIREYLIELNHGNATATFVMGDIASSLKASIVSGDKHGSSILKAQLEEAALTILDSQNRILKALIAFFNDKISITGELYDKDGNKAYFENIFFSKLEKDHPRFADAFKDAQIPVQTFYGRSYKELGNLFQKLNSNCNMVAMEYRNAYSTEIAREVRSLAESLNGFTEGYVETIKKYFSEMRDREFIAKLLVSVLKNSSSMRTDSDGLDKFYLAGVGRADGDTDEYEGLDRAREILTLVNRCLISSKDKGKISDCQLWALAHVCEYLYDQQVTIRDFKNLYDSVKNADQDLKDTSKSQNAKDISELAAQLSANGASVAAAAKDANKAFPKSKYYYFWRSNQDSPTNRKALKFALVREIDFAKLFSQGSLQKNSAHHAPKQQAATATP
jgi:hypothetical protein